MNGGSDLTDADNSWFSEPSSGSAMPVNYCVQVGKTFPLSQSEAEAMVERAVRQWIEFFRVYGMDRQVFGYEGLRASVMLPNRETRRLSLQFQKIDCAANSPLAVNPDLMILLGTSTPELDQIKGGTPEQEYGAAIRGSYNQATHRNPGTIWIGDGVKSRNRAEHLLLHELGHVFGMKHDSVFVMDSQIIHDIKNADLDETYFGRIESSAWPFEMRNGIRVTISGEDGEQQQRPRLERLCERDETLLVSLPQSIRRFFKSKLPPASDPCVKIELEMLEVRKTKIEVRLHLIHSKFAVAIDGQFQMDRFNLLRDDGPGIYSQWINLKAENPGEKHWLRVPLNKHLQSFPARGLFEAKGANIHFPAQIHKERGFTLEIYDESVKKWFVLRNPYN